MKNPIPLLSLLPGAFFICLAMTGFAGCSHYDQFLLTEKQDGLQKNIYQFNKRFEGKMMDLSASYLPPDDRPQFLVDSLKIKENVLFYDSSVLDVRLFEGELPVTFREDGQNTDFNKAIVSMRYQMAILPSNKVKTIFVNHLWEWNENDWYVVPDLQGFLK